MGNRIKWLRVMLILALVILGGRLVVLQLVDGDYYKVLADENRVRLKILPANRGVIYDRHGEVLSRNAPEGRDYVYGAVMSHVLGYVGEVSENQWITCRQTFDCDYYLGEIVGKLGLEKQYDQLLRGQAGGIIVEQDATGEILREIGNQDPVAGESLTTTLDAGLQRKAYELLAGRKGALIASIPQTGEILALVSSPAFNPNQVAEYLSDKELPLFDRAIGGEYPPGSTFKIITSLASLEEGKIDASTLIEDTGEIRIGPFRYGNWYFDAYGQKEGELNIVRAIARSNDIFFYKIGERLGINHLADWAKYFGVGKVTGIDLPGEANGLMPDPDWKKDYFNENWFLGDTYISAIGQGNILMTPLQVNQMMSVMASNGFLCRPYLVKIEPDCLDLEIDQANLNLVLDGLKQVTETGGTAFPFFDFSVNGRVISVAGKTGTAEFGNPDPEDLSQAKTHAWFTVTAPSDGPQIVVTVLLEAAGEGSEQAAPVAKDLLTYWFLRQK